MRFTVTAVSPASGTGPRPCAVVDAVSEDAALRDAGDMIDDGTLAFLPPDARLSVRRTSRPESEAMDANIRITPGSAPTASGDAATRAHRLRRAFFEKLWRGDIDPGAERASRRRPKPS